MILAFLIISSLASEIRILNLLNGLDLDSTQSVRIGSLARTAALLKQEYLTKDEGLEVKLEPLLDQLKEFLLNNEEIPTNLKRSIHRIQESRLKLRAEYDKGLDSLSSLVISILRPEQVYTIENYRPCLIPPPGEARIGQSDNPLGLYHLLDRVRRMPDRIYRRNREEIVKKILEKIEIHRPPWVKLDQEKLRDEISLLFDQARRLDDLDYILKRQALAKRLRGFDFKPANDLNWKIKKFLLTEEADVVLKRLSQP